jgi:hypothetical protein
MIITTLIVMIALLSFVQDNSRMRPAMILSAFLVAHDMFLSELGGLSYYLSDAIFCALVITLTARLKKVPKLTIRLQRAMLAGIALNLYGWIIWMLYLDPITYNISFMFLYGYIVIELLRGDGVEHGDIEMDNWVKLFRLNYSKCGVGTLQNTKEGKA